MKLPAAADLDWIRKFRRALARRIDPFCALVSEELGKPAFETLTSDLIPLLEACRWHERHARRVLAPRRLLGSSLWRLGQSHFVMRVPVGRVAILATWNYPIQLLGVQLVQALVGGNHVTVKPSERAPRTQQSLLELARECGMNEQRLRWTSAERAEGERLLVREHFDHVVFTGSTEVGRIVATTLARTLTPSTLELSGADSALVLGDADPDLAAASILYGVALSAGQTCMAPRRAIVHARVYDSFLRALHKHARRQRPVAKVCSAEAVRLEHLAREAERAGARRIESGWPLILADCACDCAFAAGRHFGPALAVIRADTDAHMLEMHRSCTQRLATSVFTRDPVSAAPLAAELGSGIVTFNDCVVPTAHPALGIGGVGESGWGITRGEAGLFALTRPVYVLRTHARLRLPTDRSDQGTQRRVAAFTRWRYGR